MLRTIRGRQRPYAVAGVVVSPFYGTLDKMQSVTTKSRACKLAAAAASNLTTTSRSSSTLSSLLMCSRARPLPRTARRIQHNPACVDYVYDGAIIRKSSHPQQQSWQLSILRVMTTTTTTTNKNDSNTNTTSAAHAVSIRPQSVTVPVPPPSWSSLKSLFIVSAIPMVGFGFMDNLVMIQAGQYIDTTLGVQLGMATLTAAAAGQVVSDVSGVLFGGTLERTISRLALVEPPAMTAAQRQLTISRNIALAGAVCGVMVGCALGATTLLFLDLEARERMQRAVALQHMIHDLIRPDDEDEHDDGHDHAVLPCTHAVVYVASKDRYSLDLVAAKDIKPSRKQDEAMAASATNASSQIARHTTTSIPPPPPTAGASVGVIEPKSRLQRRKTAVAMATRRDSKTELPDNTTRLESLAAALAQGVVDDDKAPQQQVPNNDLRTCVSTRSVVVSTNRRILWAPIIRRGELLAVVEFHYDDTDAAAKQQRQHPQQQHVSLKHEDDMVSSKALGFTPQDEQTAAVMARHLAIFMDRLVDS